MCRRCMGVCVDDGLHRDLRERRCRVGEVRGPLRERCRGRDESERGFFSEAGARVRFGGGGTREEQHGMEGYGLKAVRDGR
jgi:hypothetical protein